jgi:hypothetical protein
MAEAKYLFAFFPYLKTSDPVRYRNLTIRSSDDNTGLPPEAIQHLETIRPMFFLRDHVRIKRMSYAFLASTDKLTPPQFTKQLLEFQTLISFTYSTPHPSQGDPFLCSEHSSLYVFQPTRQVPTHLLVGEDTVEVLSESQVTKSESKLYTEGYTVTLNDKSYFWVTPGSRIYPPSPSLWLNISQDLSHDFHYVPSERTLYRSLVDYLSLRDESDNMYQRILTALTWYNRSTGINIDESVALVNLAIAFESLLDLEQGEQLTTRFKDAVTLLVSDVPRLESWLFQFYKARSDIVHKGKSTSLMFVATDNPRKASERLDLEYRSLVSYGRQIFQVCVATIITGAQIAKRLNLASLLVTNQQRLESICQILNKPGGTPLDRILASSRDVQDINTYQFVQEKGLKYEQLIGTAKLMVQQYLDSAPNESPELIEQMNKFSAVDSANHYEALSLLKEIQEGLERAPSSPMPKMPNNPRITVVSLIDTVWHYTFIYYFQLKDSHK